MAQESQELSAQQQVVVESMLAKLRAFDESLTPDERTAFLAYLGVGDEPEVEGYYVAFAAIATALGDSERAKSYFRLARNTSNPILRVTSRGGQRR